MASKGSKTIAKLFPKYYKTVFQLSQDYPKTISKLSQTDPKTITEPSQTLTKQSKHNLKAIQTPSQIPKLYPKTILGHFVERGMSWKAL